VFALYEHFLLIRMTNATYSLTVRRTNKTALAVGLILTLISVTETQAADEFADCDAKAKTTLDMENCAGAERDRAYGKLNAVYKKLAAKVTPQGQEKLKAARDAWEIYNKKQCAFNMAGSEDARLYTLNIVLCYAHMANDYAGTLSKQLHCTEGDLACGGQ
jgi:uncharacterized protein YecT (DUF1311 family)